MDELLVIVLQAIFEFIVEVISYDALLLIPSPDTRRGSLSVTYTCMIWFFVGCVLAGISTRFLTHTFISHPALRIGNLVVAPVTSALIALTIARRRSLKNPQIVPSHHFWRALWFTIGLVTVRFAYATHA